MPPSKQKDKKAVKSTEPKAYKLPSVVVREIRKAASIYGAHGRAVQVGAEMLKRLPLDIPEPNSAPIKSRTFRCSTKTAKS
jgi:hypothetical protein